VKIALFQPKSLFASWFSVGGYVSALTRMGHQVTEFAFPGNHVSNEALAQVRPEMPTIGQLNEQFDVVLSAYHEYTQPWLSALFRHEQWKRLTIPVIARFDESMDREDLLLSRRIDELKSWADYFSFPAVQDAEKYGGRWVPYGSDLQMFGPGVFAGRASFPVSGEEKKYDVAFIGSMYPQRKAYFDQLMTQFPQGYKFHVGNVLCQDLSGLLFKQSMELLAANYRQIKVFFCLPPMSRLIVQKVLDIMACGTMVMYPRLPGAAAKNLTQFDEGQEIVYYDPGNMIDNGKQIWQYLEDKTGRESIAAAGHLRVVKDYTIEQMLEAILSHKAAVAH
jgi:hypothetical protein